MHDLNPSPRLAGVVRRAVLVLALALWAGCVPKLKGIEMREADLALPEQFAEDVTAESDLAPFRDADLFDDPELVALIEEGLRFNRELQAMKQEINIANAEIIARRGEVFPRLGLGVSAGIDKPGRYTSRGAADAGSEIEPGRETPENLTDFRVAFNASWEIDIWRKLANATDAARMRFVGSVEGRRFVITGLVAEIARTYYELESLDNQLIVLEQNIALLQDALEVVRMQQTAARVTMLGVQRFEAELMKYEARRYTLQQQIVVAENRLNLLVGRYPRTVSRNSEAFVATEPVDLQAGLPSQLLERRPDIRQAELGLQAAKLDVKVARARFYPSLSIDADLGIQTFSLLKFGAMPASLLYGAFAKIMAPLLNRADIKADYFAANAKQMQAVVGYEQTVLTAFSEVVTTLAAIRNIDQRFERKARQVDLLKQAIDTSNALFASARADYLEVLTTRREALEAELELIETKESQLVSRIDLYRALGGGWPEDDGSQDDQATADAAQGGH